MNALFKNVQSRKAYVVVTRRR